MLISCKNCKIKGFLHEQTDEIFGIKVISILFICSVGQTLPPHPAKDSCQALDKSLAAISMTWLAYKGLGGIPALRIQLQVEEHSLEYAMTAISTGICNLFFWLTKTCAVISTWCNTPLLLTSIFVTAM